MWSHLRSLSCVFLVVAAVLSFVGYYVPVGSRVAERRPGPAHWRMRWQLQRLTRRSRKTDIDAWQPNRADRVLSVPTGTTTQARNPDPTRCC